MGETRRKLPFGRGRSNWSNRPKPEVRPNLARSNNGPFTRCSLDHLVGAGQDRWRDGESKHLGGLEIDHQLKLDRLLDWQIGGVLAPLGTFVWHATPPLYSPTQSNGI